MSLTPIKLNQEIRQQLNEKLNPLIIKDKPGKGDLRYISQNTCVDILNKIFGHNWSMEIIDHWMEPGYNQIIKRRYNYKTRQYEWPNGVNPLPEAVKLDEMGIEYVSSPQLPTAWCIVKLTIPFEDEKGNITYVSKCGFGSQSITGPQATQAQNGYKGAQSDALKKAATLLGIALELYRDNDEAKYYDEMSYMDLMLVWDDELKEKHSESWKYIDEVCTKCNYTYADLAYWVSEATNAKCQDLLCMPEKYMDKFIELLKKEDLI